MVGPASLIDSRKTEALVTLLSHCEDNNSRIFQSIVRFTRQLV
jgi:hypothetical protein